jgi:hypothetical protein
MNDDQAEVVAVKAWPSNAHLIRDVARLGYLRGHVCDVTYGLGTFWKLWMPERLTCHDKALDGVDFRHLPYDDETFDAVVFDPPYKLSGTPALGDFDARFGIDVPVRWQDRLALICDGARECARVTAAYGHLLVKVQDQVCSGAMRWQTDEVTAVATSCGLTKVDRFDLLGGGRSQPAGRRQVHARQRPSTLLVFRREARSKGVVAAWV